MEKQMQAMPGIQLYEENKLYNSDIGYGNVYFLTEGMTNPAEILNSFETEILDLNQVPHNAIEIEMLAEGITICWREEVEEWV